MVEEKQKSIFEVKIIIDANIVFSAILNTNGKIGDLLMNSHKHFIFIAPEFLRHEVVKHQIKLSRISGLSINEINESIFYIFQSIQFISEEQIKTSSWHSAAALLKEIDPNDTPYVAYAKHFRCKIWSGDKKLSKGLNKKGVNIILNTEEPFLLRSKKQNKVGKRKY